MAKMPLTIKTTYLPNWGVWEGIRELIQNGRDAETEFHAKLTVTHKDQTLRIENEGCTLPHEALLFGHTSKNDRGDMIGKFGEGLKLGILALVRAGRPVKIRSGAEVWTPTIARSDTFNADVLVVDIQGGREPKDRVRVEVGGVTEVEWSELRGKFLFLADGRKKSGAIVHTDDGDLLLDGAEKGKIFVKGIFVQTSPKLEYGYNFSDMNVDRDRKMVNSWDVEYATQRIWRATTSQRPDLFGSFLDMVEDGKEDVKNLNEYSVGNLSEDVLKGAADAFRAKHGTDAIPVGNMAEAHDIEHLGKIGIVVKPQMAILLSKTIGTVETVKVKLAEEVTETYSPSAFSPDETKNLADAEMMLKDAGVDGVGKYTLNVVNFRSPGLRGQCKGGKDILLARKILADADLTLRVLVHEVAHANGGDGDKGHVNALEESWSKITSYLRKLILMA